MILWISLQFVFFPLKGAGKSCLLKQMLFKQICFVCFVLFLCVSFFFFFSSSSSSLTLSRMFDFSLSCFHALFLFCIFFSPVFPPSFFLGIITVCTVIFEIRCAMRSYPLPPPKKKKIAKEKF